MSDDSMDWRQLKKIDAHVHLLPEEVRRANPHMEPPFSAAQAESHLKIMEQFHIEKAILMPFNDPSLMSMGFTAAAVHENLRQICGQYPGRYAAFADIDVRVSPRESCGKIRNALQSSCFKGIKIHPNNTEMEIDNVYNDYIFDLAEELDVPIAIHAYPDSRRKYDSGDFCAPARIAKIARRHPAVRLILCHLGGFQWRDCVGLDAYFDFSSVLPDLVREYGLKETNRILRQFDPGRLLFASDWPCSRSLPPDAVYESTFAILNAMDFSPEEASRIAYDNIADLLGL